MLKDLLASFWPEGSVGILGLISAEGLLASFWPEGSLGILWMISAEGLIGKLLAKRESGRLVNDQC